MEGKKEMNELKEKNQSFKYYLLKEMFSVIVCISLITFLFMSALYLDDIKSVKNILNYPDEEYAVVKYKDVDTVVNINEKILPKSIRTEKTGDGYRIVKITNHFTDDWLKSILDELDMPAADKIYFMADDHEKFKEAVIAYLNKENEYILLETEL